MMGHIKATNHGIYGFSNLRQWELTLNDFLWVDGLKLHKLASLEDPDVRFYLLDSKHTKDYGDTGWLFIVNTYQDTINIKAPLRIDDDGYMEQEIREAKLGTREKLSNIRRSKL